MKFLDYLRLAWDQLRRRKVVTLLCMMGIGIGSSSIIVALSFSESVTQFSEQRLGFYLKTDEIEVFAGRGGDVSNPLIANDTYALTEQKIKVIQQLPHVVGTAHFQEFGYHSFIVDQTKQGSAEVIATDFEALEQFGYELQQGSFDHVHNGIILSYGATMNLRDTRLPVILKQSANTEEQPIFAYPMYQKMITLEVNSRDDGGNIVEHQIPLRVVGILKRPEGMPDDLVQHNNMAFVTQETADRIMDVLESERVSDVTLKIKVDSVENVKETETLVQKLKLSTMSNLYRLESMQQEFVILRLLLGGIGGFILFVASISIIVAMTMSTYQRRKQIGIMKVLGSSLAQIRNMFIVESALLGLLGGIAGIVLSYWVIWGINALIIKFSGGSTMEDELLFISWVNIVIGMFFAIMTGILSGIFPAIKASRTDALTAIKRE